MQAVTTIQPGIRVGHIARRLPALGALIFGFALLYGVGFTNATLAHNAAHDTRHANGFPCH